MPLRDASMTALQRQRETFRRMTPEQRLAVAAEMSDEIRAVAEAGIRQRHPDYSAMLDIGGQSLDLAYIDRWVAGLGLHAAWSRARALRSAD